MIEVYVGGNTYYECEMDIEIMHMIMTDDIIKPETFIKLRLSDGCIGYVRKGSVISFNNVSEAERR